MNEIVAKQKGKYEISTQVMEKPGDEIRFLKRTHRLMEDGCLVIQTHHKHIQQMRSLLGLNRKLQSKKTPAHADLDQEDTTDGLGRDECSKFRTCVGMLMYLSTVPQCQFVIRHLSTYLFLWTDCEGYDSASTSDWISRFT